MKKTVLLTFLLVAGLSYGQREKEQISLNIKVAEVNQNIKATIENYNPETTYILDVETADDLMILDKSLIDSLGVFNFYIEKEGNHLASFKKVNSKTGEKEYLQSLTFRVTPEKVGFVINKITINQFSKNKDDYKAWDNSMGSYLPDVYIDLNINDKKVYSTGVSPNRKYNEQFSFKTQPLWKIGVDEKFNRNDLIKLILWDDDSVTDDDYMGGIQFSRGTIKRQFPKTKNIKKFEFKENDLVIIISYEWMDLETLKKS